MNELRKELMILECLDIKPNYKQLALKHNCDWRTIKKYNNGYEGKSKTRIKRSMLDDLKDIIIQKINLPGATIYGVYMFLKNIHNYEGTYQNLNRYIQKNNLKASKQKNIPRPRYETEMGEQLQFDWKEDLVIKNKFGIDFQFNIFSSTLGASRLHIFKYSKTKTRDDVLNCLIDTFKYINGVPQKLLTDNMSSIVDTKKKTFFSEFQTFCRDMGCEAKNCRVRTPETKGKVESSNRFMSWLIPYEYQFETEEELIEIIEKITKQVNLKINDSIGTTPLMLFNKEKEYLKPLPSKEVLNGYTNDLKSVFVDNTFLIHFKGNKYSVPPKFINKHVQIKELEDKLYIYYNKNLIGMHVISNKKINYDKNHYSEGMYFNYNLKESNKDLDLKIEENLKRFDTINY